MACSLLSSVRMTVTRIVKLADGEEMISFESSERSRASSVVDDPRRGALERRGAAEAASLQRAERGRAWRPPSA